MSTELAEIKPKEKEFEAERKEPKVSLVEALVNAIPNGATGSELAQNILFVAYKAGQAVQHISTGEVKPEGNFYRVAGDADSRKIKEVASAIRNRYQIEEQKVASEKIVRFPSVSSGRVWDTGTREIYRLQNGRPFIDPEGNLWTPAIADVQAESEGGRYRQSFVEIGYFREPTLKQS